MIIAIGSDLGGFEAKREIIRWITEKRILSFMDFGTHSGESCDYPIMQKVYVMM